MYVSGELDAPKKAVSTGACCWSGPCLLAVESSQAQQPCFSLDVDTARVRTATAAVTRARAGVASVAVTAGVVGSARRVGAVVGAHVSTVQESDD